jgi:hypothetical protein
MAVQVHELTCESKSVLLAFQRVKTPKSKISLQGQYNRQTIAE